MDDSTSSTGNGRIGNKYNGPAWFGSNAAVTKYAQLPLVDGIGRAAWGVFGDDDQVGTLNRTTEERVRDGAQLVRHGKVFPLNWRLDLPRPAVLGRQSLLHRFISLDGGFDDAYDSFYPQGSSQWDALCHVEHPQLGYYNGHWPEEVGTTEGRLGIDNWARRGIAGRWILADLERALGPTEEAIDCGSRQEVSIGTVADVLASENVAIKPGDILLIRFGWISWYESLDQDTRENLSRGQQFDAPGLAPQEQTVEWLWDNQVAAVAADCPALEAMPFDKTNPGRFLHARLVPLLGMAIGELFCLDELAHHCAEDGVYEGLFASAPLNMPGGAGSPANALALK